MTDSSRRRAGRPRRPARRAGLSLLEVLVSLAILLISLAAIGALVNFGAGRGMAAHLETTGTRLAQSKLAEVEAGVIPVTSPESNVFEDEPEWSYTVEPTPTDVPNVYAVTVRVSRAYGLQTFEMALTQLIYDPAMMGDAAEAQPPTTATSPPGGSTGTPGSSTSTSGSASGGTAR